MRIRDWSSDACSSDLIIKGSALAALEDSNEEIGRKAVIELMKQVDAYIPEPERPLDKPFMMPIEDVFSISGRGTVVTGRVETGIIKVGEEVEIVGIHDTRKTTVTGVEMFRKLDRKRVVQGKSVAVRVDLGGRGIIKKKTK